MKKTLILIFTVFLSIGLLSCATDNTNPEDQLIVAVSIVPQSAFVEAIAGDLVEVSTIIPPGYSPGNYEPSAKTMADLNDAAVYFTIGVPTEEANILPQLEDLDINIVHLEDIVAAEYDDLTLSAGGRDPHIWLSIKRVKVMVEAIADKLVEIDSENALTYRQNEITYLQLLDDTNTTIENTFTDLTMDIFIIFHPAFGYFADEYDLDMITLQENGQEATAAHLEEVIDAATDLNIGYVFYQSEIDSTQVESFADEIDAEMVELFPLSEEYVSNLLEMAGLIKGALR